MTSNRLLRVRLPPATARPVRLPDPSSGADPAAPVVFFLPARNEAATVGDVLTRAPSHVGPHPVLTIVVDDGSTDATRNVALEAGARVVSCGGRGVGAAVRIGLTAALEHDPVAAVFCDADGEYAPEELPMLVQPILDGRAEYVVGSRFAGRIDRMRLERRVGNQILTRALAFAARTPITDGQSGYRALSRGATAAAEVGHDYNYAQVLTLSLLGKGFGYAEVPITYAFREHGKSFVRFAPYLRAVIPAVARELRAASAAAAADGR